LARREERWWRHQSNSTGWGGSLSGIRSGRRGRGASKEGRVMSSSSARDEEASARASVKRHEYGHGDVKLFGYVAEGAATASRPRPAVLVVHTAIGPHEEFIMDKLRRLAELGYVAFGVDMFGAEAVVLGEEKVRYNKQFKDDRKLLQSRILAAFHEAASLPFTDASRVAAIGYCFGGKAVLDLARSGVEGLRASISFHGILDAPVELEGTPITARVVAFHGSRDPFIALEDKLSFHSEMEARCRGSKKWQMVEFGGCFHAFTRPDKTQESDRTQGLFYDEYAAEKSWAMMVDVLAEEM